LKLKQEERNVKKAKKFLELERKSVALDLFKVLSIDVGGREFDGTKKKASCG
jgi:hypothetical protein